MSLPRSLVLLSGGLDSVVNAKQALDQTELAGILSFDYGQQAASREIAASQTIAELFKVPFRLVGIPWMKDIDQGLTQGRFPHYDADKLDEQGYATDAAQAVWVPNRNGVMINIAAAFAESEKIDTIIVGFNREEAATFPDNTPEFLERTNLALEYSTLHHPIVASYTIDMDKTQILEWGREIDAPLKHVWSCYGDGDKMCGVCESCRRLKRAIADNHLEDEFSTLNKWGFVE